MDFHHISVLRDETIAALVTNLDGTYVDCTLGGAGHASAIAARLTETGRVVGIDQDPAAIAAASERLAGVQCGVDIIRNNFKNLSSVLAELGIEQADGFLFDLGVSSHQLDVAERGFSYMQDAPLDMRMDPDAELSAVDIVNTYTEDALSKLIYLYGEERWAKRIAKFIIAERSVKPLETTGELVDIIKKAIPVAARQEGGHPAKRTFQALRIAVNGELEILEEAFKTAVAHLRQGGRICIITFHSLEDRIAKQVLQGLAKGCICPPRMPVCACGHRSEIKIIGKPLIAQEEELVFNTRARSAKLRVAEKK